MSQYDRCILLSPVILYTVECILYLPDIPFCALYLILRTVSCSIQKMSYSARLILFFPVIPFCWLWSILQRDVLFCSLYPILSRFSILGILSSPVVLFCSLYPVLSRCPILFIIFYSGKVSHSVHCILPCLLSSYTHWILFCLFVLFCSILTYSVRLHRSTKFLLFCPIVLFCPLSPCCPVVPFYSLYPIPPSWPNRLNMPCPAQLSYFVHSVLFCLAVFYISLYPILPSCPLCSQMLDDIYPVQKGSVILRKEKIKWLCVNILRLTREYK